MRSLLSLLIGAALAAVVSTDGLPGSIIDSGAPLYPHDPNSTVACLLGCDPVGHAAAGTPVGVLCRKPDGYLHVVMAGRAPVWVFAADVRVGGHPAACGWWEG